MALYWDPTKQTRPPAQGGGTDPALERRVETLETTSGEQQAQISSIDTVLQQQAQISSIDTVLQQTAPQQLAAFARVMAVQAAPTMTDNQALTMPDLFPTWEQVLEEAQPLKKDAIINDGGTLYRVVQDNTTPQAGQPPHGEGMLAAAAQKRCDHQRRRHAVPCRAG